jgi:hypothetical protein
MTCLAVMSAILCGSWTTSCGSIAACGGGGIVGGFFFSVVDCCMACCFSFWNCLRCSKTLRSNCPGQTKSVINSLVLFQVQISIPMQT